MRPLAYKKMNEIHWISAVVRRFIVTAIVKLYFRKMPHYIYGCFMFSDSRS